VPNPLLCRICLEPETHPHLAHECRENIRKRERERVARWLRDAEDQAAEDLCDRVFAEIRRQRAANQLVGQPYLDLFADAIEAGEHLGQ